MKKKKVNKKERGLKTLFLYTFVVGFIIFLSLGIKAVFVLKQSKFDGHNLNLAIAQKNKIVGILGFNHDQNSISLLKIRNSDIHASSLGKDLGIIQDANIDSDHDVSSSDITSILTKAAFKTDSIKTDLTIFDIVRLFIFSKNVSDNDKQVKEIDASTDVFDENKVINKLFKNDNIVSDNLSIEIINATEKSGLGNRLERALSNIGAQVVSISTAHEKKNNSVIKYFGHSSYTVSKLKDLLKLPVERLKDKSVADVVIIIGEDMKNTSVF